MRVAVRCDSSVMIGSGHFMRCFTLALELVRTGSKVRFLCRHISPTLAAKVRAAGMELRILPSLLNRDCVQDLAHSSWLGVGQMEDATDSIGALKDAKWDWLIVDHYALDVRWEREVRQVVERIMVVDDLADRKHCCDVLLDQNLGKAAGHYANLVPDDCELLLGPTYALLAPMFQENRGSSISARLGRPAERLLITMGGVDKDDITGWVLGNLRNAILPMDMSITVVMGGAAPWVDRVRRLASEMQWCTEVFVDVNDMARRMVESDVAIGAAGSTTWERCCLGLPSIVLVLASNQSQIAEALAAQKACLVVDHQRSDAGTTLRSSIERLINDNDFRLAMSIAASSVTDGDGVNRVLKNLIRTAHRS